MAIKIPIITEFNGKGIAKAKREFAQLETAGQKAGFAIKKAAIPAAAAFTAVAAGLFDATKAAIADDAAQTKLANQLQRSTKATDAQIAANEEWISTQGRLLGVTDDELRPAIAGLARVTGSLEKAQKAASLAMDISAAKGVPLETVTKALEKAYGGNLNALSKIAPELKGMIKEGASAKEVMAKLGDTFGGAASQQANTAQGKFKRLKLSLDETKESIGAGLMPIVEAVMPVLQRFADWAAENPETFKLIAIAIAAVATAIMAVNAAMALNPFTAIAAGIALLVVGLAVAYKKFEGFRKVVNTVVNFVIGYFEHLINAWISVINGLIRAWNWVPGHKDVKTLGHVSFGRIGGDNPDTSSARAFEGYNPGAVASAQAVDAVASRQSVNITVQTGVGDPVAIGRSVQSALAAADRRAA